MPPPPWVARKSCCSAGRRRGCIGPGGRPGAEVQVLRGEIDGEPDMLGIETRSVIAAWNYLKLRAAKPARRCSGGAPALRLGSSGGARARAACPA